jgi:hypothetical protein
MPTITRKLNLKNYFTGFDYETADFSVLEADTPEQAVSEVEGWIAEWLDIKKKEQTTTNIFIN